MINKSITLQFILLATISIIVSTLLTGFMGYNAADNAVIEKLKTSDLKNIVSLKGGIISIRMQRAIETSKMLAADPVINKWFSSYEQEPNLGKLSKERLTQITELHDYSTVFAVNKLTGHYWKQNNTLAYTVSETDPKDAWFFNFFSSKKSLALDLDSDKISKDTHIFINTLMGTAEKPLGLAGVGLNVTELANEFSKIDKYGGKTWLIDETGNIRISSDINELGKNFNSLIGEDQMLSILNLKEEIKVFEHDLKQKGKMFYAHAPISGTNWIVIYAVSYASMTKPLITIKFTTIVSGIVSIILVVFTFYFVSHRFTRPIRELTQVAEMIALGDLNKRYITNSTNEVGVLAKSFNKMTENLQESNHNLEQKVADRTAELSETLKQVNILKVQQDGDYFLTSLITSPLFKNYNRSTITKTEFLMKQKKRFSFRKKTGELGGDICISGNLSFKGKRYTLFTNADAMGKSMQGAGGAIVFGTVLNSILSRSASNKKDLNMEPYTWLTEVFNELNTVFFTFDGSMLVSCIIGLVEDQSGKMYYFNSEHPHTVLLRDGVASFLENSTSTFKLGTLSTQNVKINTYHLLYGDILIAGSDGRDDILIISDTGAKSMHEDENSFLRIVEKTNGDLSQIQNNLNSIGEQFDDLSLLRVEYTGDGVTKEEIKLDLDAIENSIKNSSFETALLQLTNYNESHGISVLYFKALCLDRLGRGKEALPYLNRIHELKSSHVDSLRLHGHILSRAGKFEEASEYLEKAILLNPQSEKIQLALSKVKSKIKKES